MNDGKLHLRIKEKRKEKNLTQSELGKLIGKTESSIRKYEKGTINIPMKVVDQIAAALETTSAYLLGYENLDKELKKINKELKRIRLLEEELALLDCEFKLDNYDYYANYDNYYEVPEEDLPELFYNVSYKGKTLKIPCKIFHSLQDDVQDYLKFKLEQLISKYSNNK